VIQSLLKERHYNNYNNISSLHTPPPFKSLSSSISNEVYQAGVYHEVDSDVFPQLGHLEQLSGENQGGSISVSHGISCGWVRLYSVPHTINMYYFTLVPIRQFYITYMALLLY